VLALVNGAFSERFAHVAETCGRHVDRYEVAWGQAHDPREVAVRVKLGAHALVTVAHSETSTGALNDVRAISDAAHAAGAMCAIDSVTGVRGAALEFDAWNLDYVFTGSQKAIALPPGLAFAVASEAFLGGGERTGRGAYFDLAEYASNAAKGEAPNTPALPLYFALDVQLERIREEGIPRALARHAAMASVTAAWARATGLDIVAAEGHRSPTVTALRLPSPLTSAAVTKAVAAKGYTIGSGYGKLKETTIRIGHMGDHTPEGVARVLEVVADVLKAS
jgi:aspartate aminotransferase-like enzyme